MPRPIIFAALLLLATAGTARATTLLKLSLDQMIDQATGIVRGKVAQCAPELRNSTIHTVCSFTTEERLKGPADLNRFSVPGGSMRVNGRMVRQMIAGRPEFAPNQEYVLFLWTSPRGVTSLIGLSQGVLEVKQALGVRSVERAPATDVTLVDHSGNEVADQGLSLTLKALRDRVRTRAEGAAR